MKLQIHYPFKPFIVTQNWGNLNPAYSQQFDDPSFKRHNGVDAKPFQGISWNMKYPVYCPVEGFKVQQVRFQPQGGGNEMWLISKEKVQMGDKLCHAYMPLCHADKILVPAGYEPALGELIMIGDNTGFSTGTHTHMGLYRVDWDEKKVKYLDKNEATGSYDPALFFTKEYAVDKATLNTLITSNMRYYKWWVGL